MRRPSVLLLGLLAAAACAPPPAHAQQRRDVLRISFPSEDGSLTPYTFTNGYALVSLVYDTLTWRDAGGVPRPWLAASVRRDGPRRVVVRLRRGVRWHDGRRLTAADVAFTFAYVARRRHPRFTNEIRDVARVTARGERTIVFELRRPSLGFADQPLADVPILPRHLWQDVPDSRLAPPGLPVGSGPYRLVRHERDRAYRFEANRGYFRGRPLVGRIEVPIVPVEADSFELVKRGSLDAAPALLPAGQILDREPRVRFAEGISFSGTMLAFNLRRAPFSGPAARRAVARALDVEKVRGNRFGPGGMTAARRGMLHPASRWAPRRDLALYDERAARRAFAEQGPATFRVLASSDDGVRLEAARRVVAQLRRLGARARLQERPQRSFLRALGERGARPTFEAAVVGMPALASYDPAYLRTVFGDPRTSVLNHGGYRSAAFERLDDRLAAAPTVAARRRAVDAELRLLARDVPAVPLFFGGVTWAYRALDFDWVDVRGASIVDKLSFLPGARPVDRVTSAPVGDPGDSTTDEGISLVPFIVGLAAAMALAGAWVLVRGRTRRRRDAPRRPRSR